MQRSDCGDAQTDLDLCCQHIPTCTLSWVPAQMVSELANKNGNLTEFFFSQSSSQRSLQFKKVLLQVLYV